MLDVILRTVDTHILPNVCDISVSLIGYNGLKFRTHMPTDRALKGFLFRVSTQMAQIVLTSLKCRATLIAGQPFWHIEKKYDGERCNID